MSSTDDVSMGWPDLTGIPVDDDAEPGDAVTDNPDPATLTLPEDFHDQPGQVQP